MLNHCCVNPLARLFFPGAVVTAAFTLTEKCLNMFWSWILQNPAHHEAFHFARWDFRLQREGP